MKESSVIITTEVKQARAHKMNRIPITDEGHKKLSKELLRLKNIERPKIIQDITEARAHGDLSENAEYSAAREKQSFIEGKINELETIVSSAEIIDPKNFTNSVDIKFGATVEIVNLDDGIANTYQIVGDIESNIEKGKIAINSPIARALIGKKHNDIIHVKTPSGHRDYKINSISFV